MDYVDKIVKLPEFTRYLRVITDVESKTKAEQVERKFRFLKELIDDGIFNGMLTCGPVGFDKLFMEHNGVAWQIKLETEVYDIK